MSETVEPVEDLGGALVVTGPPLNKPLAAMASRLHRISGEIDAVSRDLNIEADLDAICSRLLTSMVEVSNVCAFIRNRGHEGKARWGDP